MLLVKARAGNGAEFKICEQPIFAIDDDVEALAHLLNLPSVLPFGTGVFLVVYGVAVAFIATRDPVPRPVVWLLVFGNLGWAAACIALLASSLVTPTGLGMAWVLAQAACVAVLAELQWTGLRRAPVVGWA